VYGSHLGGRIIERHGPHTWIGNNLSMVVFGIIPAPLAAHQLQLRQPDHGGISEIGHEHAYEPNGFKIAYITDPLFKLGEGNTKLVPFYLLPTTVAELYFGGMHV